MNCENNKDKIISYIENDLNENDRRLFEKELKNNSDLNSEYIEMKNLLDSMKNLPEIKTSSNFMVSLNSKIDEYEAKKNYKWYNTIFDSVSTNVRLFQGGIAALAIIFVIFLGTNVLDSDNSQPLMLSNSNLTEDVEINLTDSEIDSLIDSNQEIDSVIE